MGAGHFLKIFLYVLWFFLFFTVQSIAVELSGNAETIPKSGLIKLQGKELSLYGIQIIPQNATCYDRKGQWPCGESAWEKLTSKLNSGSINCTLASDFKNTEVNSEQANCLQKKENLKAAPLPLIPV